MYVLTCTMGGAEYESRYQTLVVFGYSRLFNEMELYFDYPQKVQIFLSCTLKLQLGVAAIPSTFSMILLYVA